MTDDALTRIERLDLEITATARRLADLLDLREKLASETEAETYTDDFADTHLVELALAAQRFEIAKDKLRRWCRDHGLGVLHGGRWRVSIPRLRRHLGRP